MTAIETTARIRRAADALLAARRERRVIVGLAEDARPHNLDEAWAVQDRIVTALGGQGAWKVGAADAACEPGVSPLPRALMHESPASVRARDFNFIGIEGEIGFRFGRDLPHRATPYTRDEVLDAVASLHPMIEIVDSRLANWRQRPVIEQMADLANHGALIVGPAAASVTPSIDQRAVEAEIRIDSVRRVALTGGNTAVDVQRLLTWLANHCALRGTPIRAGDVVTSGSCTGLVEVTAGSVIEARIGPLGVASVRIV